jgi:dolichol-phosphate mannosyltransferase
MIIFIQVLRSEQLSCFIKYCVVGSTGFLLDMGLLFLLADPQCLAWNVSLSKICAAEASMLSNFVCNELWTFRRTGVQCRRESTVWRRLLVFNSVCAVGVGLSVVLLYLFYDVFRWNLYLSNFFAIGLVTFWNFGINTCFTWPNSGWPAGK